MKLLENAQIRLRALEPEDLDLLYCWENNTEWWSMGATLAPYSRYVLKEYIASSDRDIFDLKQLRLMVERTESEAVIGMVDLYDFDVQHRRAGIGILIDPLYQGQGLAAAALVLLIEYAFLFLRLHQVYAHIPERNEASKALFTRCGFTRTGTLNDWIVTPEGYADVLVMQRLNDAASV